MESTNHQEDSTVRLSLQREEAPGKVPAVADIERIAALTDPLLRNLQITHCYHELSLAFTQRTGALANWCTFATWASRQAGHIIRQADMIQKFERLFSQSPKASETMDRVVASVLRLRTERDALSVCEAVKRMINPQAAFDRASEAIGRGNTKIFGEIGREFARFLATCYHDTVFDSRNIEQFCEALQPGEPPDGQRYLRQAFTRYYQALFEPDRKMRAELIFWGNLEAGFHEQIRLQPEIFEALNAPVADPQQIADHLLEENVTHLSWFFRLCLFLARLLPLSFPLDEACSKLVDHMQTYTRLLVSEGLMTLHLPNGEVLKLGSALPKEFPETLRHLTHPELLRLLNQIDPTPKNVQESGTEDWANCADRIHVITDFFRAYQEEPSLFSAPFTPAQVLLLKAGQRPAGLF